MRRDDWKFYWEMLQGDGCICGVEDLRWCRSAKLLQRLLAALEKIRRLESQEARKPGS
jgi:hypothetical protein